MRCARRDLGPEFARHRNAHVAGIDAAAGEDASASPEIATALARPAKRIRRIGRHSLSPAAIDRQTVDQGNQSGVVGTGLLGVVGVTGFLWDWL